MSYNLIEDEKEARMERSTFYFGIILVLAGALMIWINRKRRE